MSQFVKINLVIGFIASVITIYDFLTVEYQIPKVIEFDDHGFFLTVAKTVIVFISYIVAFFFSIIAFIYVELPAKLFGAELGWFMGIWSFVWNKITIQWYWANANEWGVVCGVFLIIYGIFMSDW